MKGSKILYAKLTKNNPHITLKSEINQAKPYTFGYSIKDKYSEQHRDEHSIGAGGVKGSYGYIDAKGVYRKVEYVADKDGFRAKIKTNEPGTANQDPADVKLHKNEKDSYKNAEYEKQTDGYKYYSPIQGGYGGNKKYGDDYNKQGGYGDNKKYGDDYENQGGYGGNKKYGNDYQKQAANGDNKKYGDYENQGGYGSNNKYGDDYKNKEAMEAIVIMEIIRKTKKAMVATGVMEWIIKIKEVMVTTINIMTQMKVVMVATKIMDMMAKIQQVMVAT
ncbi:hypothetical protein CEXT_308061 [Caerostris extrusa]|uniref:Uncharacterized protein n=1 Tax=Caerostris extrusa TaxID=172846 RepID=A0AAV4VHZ2_CAEEX|nr:hypothetical protein CEXT_308061 [Caerostris extrusa]